MTQSNRTIAVPWTSMRSKLDNRIYSLFLKAMTCDEYARQKGLAIREIRYVFGSYRPSGAQFWNSPMRYRWLDKFKKDYGGLKRYSEQHIWNRCNAMYKKDVLKKSTANRYVLGPCYTYPGTALDKIRLVLKRTSREDVKSCGFVTMVGLSNLDGVPDRANLLNEIFQRSVSDAFEQFNLTMRELKRRSIDKRMVKWQGKNGPIDRDYLPLIVVDLNSLWSTLWIDNRLGSVCPTERLRQRSTGSHSG